jgi:hypothetical protein
MKQLSKEKVFRELDKIAKKSNEYYTKDYLFDELQLHICFREHENCFIEECIDEYLE